MSEKSFPWALRETVRTYIEFVVGFRKHEFMQEENNSIFHQRTQNDWSKESLYILKLLPKHIKQTTKCHAVQVYVAIEIFKNLDIG